MSNVKFVADHAESWWRFESRYWDSDSASGHHEHYFAWDTAEEKLSAGRDEAAAVVKLLRKSMPSHEYAALIWDQLVDDLSADYGTDFWEPERREPKAFDGSQSGLGRQSEG